ncbi:hypothetical protein [Paenibacillus planticolens]|uniref:Uncharacterized protein n=1 Tax=Paenibacillus planticolens TaxID=2654976 RepID=A0ABX1ZQB0_9BACL|nr:hypothetical protein [Paenibacillus planticolens]NOV01853.1 hypothetical protein [Paenibacillus planticolens]
MIRLKRKAMIVSLSLSTFLVMSTAYACSDAGVPLQNWYKASFQQGNNEVNSKALQDLNEGRQGMKALVNEKVSTTAASLKQVQDVKRQQAIDRVETVNRNYVSQIEHKAAELAKTEGSAEFDEYVSASSEKMDREIDRVAVETLQELTSKINDSKGD